jgi:hypothetical protein
MGSENARRPDTALTVCRPPHDLWAGITKANSESDRLLQESSRAARVRACLARRKNVPFDRVVDALKSRSTKPADRFHRTKHSAAALDQVGEFLKFLAARLKAKAVQS